jgi:DNA repair protein RadA/Sms
MGKCEQCQSWNSLAEEVLESSQRKPSIGKAFKVSKLSEIESQSSERIKTGIDEADRVLGGGIVPGSLILVGGDPGIGKSTLVLDLASKISGALYISGEESEKQIQLRANRMGVGEDTFVLSETNLENILATVLIEKPPLVILDSIQTIYTNDVVGTPGGISQLSLCTSKVMNFAKDNHISFIIIGHVTKEGNIAGPRMLEHLVDVVLYLEGDRFGSFRILRGIKNRFGSTNETGIFEMSEHGLKEVQNPSEILLSERALKAPGSVIFPALEGTRPLLVEIQALSSGTTFGYPKRTSSGFDLNRLNLLTAVLQKRGGVNLSTQDIYLNVAGGLKVSEPAGDLAVCLAIASAFKNKPIKEDIVAFGEVGLAGEVRSVNNIEKRLKEAEKLGFNTAVIPKSHSGSLKLKGLKIITVASIKEAIDCVVS